MKKTASPTKAIKRRLPKKPRRTVKHKTNKLTSSVRGTQAKKPPRAKSTVSSSKEKKVKRRKKRRFCLKELLFSLAGGSILAVVISSFFITALTVHGYSMMPALRDGDKVVLKKTNELQRFDLATFSLGEGKSQIRRVIGLPGETIRYQEDVLYVNEQPVDEKFLIEAINESQKNGRNYTEDFTQKIVKIPEGYYFVLGDNRPYAADSRHYGLIAEKNIIGKVIAQFFPLNEIKTV